MTLLKKFITPLLIAFIGLIVFAFILLNSDDARAGSPNSAEAINAAIAIYPGSDVQIAGGGAQLPEIAANNNFVAVVYELSNKVYLRAAETGWGVPKLVDSSNNGNFPKIAFKSSSTNTVHAVWTGYVSGVPQKAIRHISCTLAEPTITCGTIHTIASTSFSTTTLQLPDVVVDSSDRIHVVWVENTNTGSSLKSVRSTDDGATWGTPATIPLAGDDDGGQPSLAVAGSNVHLAYRDKTGSLWTLNYRRAGTAENPHNWAAAGTTAVNEADIAGDVHGQFSNPIIAASGSNLYVVWDAQKDSPNQLQYALIGVAGTNGSLNLVANMKDITGTHSVYKNDIGAKNPTDHRSQTAAVPPVEDTLRPSIGVKTGGEFVVVWQERQAADCSVGGGIVAGGSSGIGASASTNGTSEIFYADNYPSWSTVNILADSSVEYSIDPDIAIDTNGTHIVFMKDTSIGQGAACADGAGAVSEYGLYYRGPFTSFVASGDIYLPIIIK